MNRLKELREKEGLSQTDLANKIGVHYRSIQNWEKQEPLQIKLDKAEKLAEYFGVHVPYLMGWSNELTMEDEINQIISDFNSDFINFLKYHDLYLSDEQIKLITNTMYSMSNINNLYLSKFVSDEDINGLKIARKLFFSELFEYSTHWQMNYDGVKTLNEINVKNSKKENTPHTED